MYTALNITVLLSFSKKPLADPGLKTWLKKQKTPVHTVQKIIGNNPTVESEILPRTPKTENHFHSKEVYPK